MTKKDKKYKNPTLTCDVIVLKDKKILLIKRATNPFLGQYALPGGFVEYGETTEKAAKREVFEETGLKVNLLGILGVYSKPKRDPRGHIIALCYQAEPKGFILKDHPEGRNLKKGKEVACVKWFPLDKVPRLAFDHNQMIEDFKGFLACLPPACRQTGQVGI